MILAFVLGAFLFCLGAVLGVSIVFAVIEKIDGDDDFGPIEDRDDWNKI